MTITGGAQDFALAPDLHMAFDRGIVTVGQAAKAWFFTSGSDTGVMKHVGSAMSRYDVHRPLIGIFPLGVTKGKGVLTMHKGKVAPYVLEEKEMYADGNGAPLNPYHTHFVLVDNGVEGSGAWGSEICMRSALEAAAVEIKGTPIVQLVVQGGPGTIKTVLSTAMVRHPLRGSHRG